MNNKVNMHLFLQDKTEWLPCKTHMKGLQTLNDKYSRSLPTTKHSLMC